jgi:hypothetical protein
MPQQPPHPTPPTAHRRRARPGRVCLTVTAAALVLGSTGPVLAQASQGATGTTNGIYTCTDNQGRRLTADRPIAQCSDREQQVLNRDGSLRRILPPSLTADERAAKEAQERLAAQQRAALLETMRRDRNLLARYPDESTHQRAREAALDTVRNAMRATENRLRELAEERRPLEAEAEFFAGREMPVRLRVQINAVEAATNAQREATVQQQAELARINRLFDIELDRLRRLWAGAAPGSMGPLANPQQVLAGYNGTLTPVPVASPAGPARP